MKNCFLIAFILLGVCVLTPSTSTASGGSSEYVRLRCTVPSTSGLSRALRRKIELDLAQDSTYVRVRVNIRFRRGTRPEQFQVHVDEALRGVVLSRAGDLRYQISGTPQLYRCVTPYDVTIQVTATRLVDSYGHYQGDFDGFGCEFGERCFAREEIFTQFSTSRVDLEGILVN